MKFNKEFINSLLTILGINSIDVININLHTDEFKLYNNEIYLPNDLIYYSYKNGFDENRNYHFKDNIE